MKKLLLLLLAVFAPVALSQTPAPGLSKSGADARYGTPPTTGSLSGYGAAKGPTDVYGSLSNGWGPNSFLGVPLPPSPFITPHIYYINCCTSMSIGGWTVGTNTATITTSSGNINNVQVGDIYSLDTLPGGISGISLGTYVVTAVNTGTPSITIACPTTTGTFTSGGAGHIVRNGMNAGSDSNSGTFASPWATMDKAQTALQYSTSVSAVASATNGINCTVTSSTGFIVGNYANISSSSVSAYNGHWLITAIPDGTHVTVQGPTYSATATATIKAFPGGVQILMNDGVYAESSGGNNRFIPSGLWDNWFCYSGMTINPTKVTVVANSGTNGVINIRGSAASRYQFSNLTIQAAYSSPCFWFNPSASTNTGNGFHFFNCLFQQPSGASSTATIQLGISSTNISVTSCSSGTGGLIQCNTTNTQGLANGNVVSIPTNQTITGSCAPLATGQRYVVSNVVSNSSFTLVGTTFASSSISAIIFNYLGTDTPLSDLAFVNCQFQSTGTGAKGPLLFQGQPASNTGTFQPFSNIGWWGCTNQFAATTTNSVLYDDWSENSCGINGLSVVGNQFTTNDNHAFLTGVDQSSTGNLGSTPSAQCTNVYVGFNYFNAGPGSANGHGLEIGDQTQNAVVEYNWVYGGLHGIVIKGANNTIVRRNTVQLTGNIALSCLYPKGSTYTQLLCNDVYAAYAGDRMLKIGYDSVSGQKEGNTTAVNNWLTADNNATALYWGGSSESTGGGTSNYNLYDVRASATWGSLRGTSVSSLATLQSTWGSAGLSGDLSTNDNNSKVMTVGTNGTLSSGTGGVIRVALTSTSGIAVGNVVYENGVTGLTNGYYVVSAVSANTYIELSGTTYSSQSGGTTTWGRNDTVYVGGSSAAGQTYYCQYIYQDGRQFTGNALETYNPAYHMRYAWLMLESTIGSTGSYFRPVPYNLPAGQWTVVIRLMTGKTPQASDPQVAIKAAAYGS